MNSLDNETRDARRGHVHPGHVAAPGAWSTDRTWPTGRKVLPHRPPVAQRAPGVSPQDLRQWPRNAVPPGNAAARPNPPWTAQVPVHDPAFIGQRPARSWPLWVAVAVSSAALIAAGYLGAFVQMDMSRELVPRLTSESPSAALPPPSPQAWSFASGARVNGGGATLSGARASTRAHAPQPTVLRIQSPAAPRVHTWTARPATHAVAAQPTAAAISAELYRQRPPVLTIRPLSADEGATAPTIPSALDQPRREDVQQGLEQVRAQLLACAGGRHGTINAHVTIVGSGRISYSLIEGDFVGTPAGSCMARALRAATFPPFAAASFKVLYPFSL